MKSPAFLVVLVCTLEEVFESTRNNSSSGQYSLVPKERHVRKEGNELSSSLCFANLFALFDFAWPTGHICKNNMFIQQSACYSNTFFHLKKPDSIEFSESVKQNAVN